MKMIDFWNILEIIHPCYTIVTIFKTICKIQFKYFSNNFLCHPPNCVSRALIANWLIIALLCIIKFLIELLKLGKFLSVAGVRTGSRLYEN